jgi:hypothetical protein
VYKNWSLPRTRLKQAAICSALESVVLTERNWAKIRSVEIVWHLTLAHSPWDRDRELVSALAQDGFESAGQVTRP